MFVGVALTEMGDLVPGDGARVGGPGTTDHPARTWRAAAGERYEWRSRTPRAWNLAQEPLCKMMHNRWAALPRGAVVSGHLVGVSTHGRARPVSTYFPPVRGLTRRLTQAEAPRATVTRNVIVTVDRTLFDRQQLGGLRTADGSRVPYGHPRARRTAVSTPGAWRTGVAAVVGDGPSR